MLNSVFLLNKDATILIEKQYREKVSRSEIDSACLAIRDKIHSLPSIISQGEYTILIHQQNDIFIVGVCEGDELAMFPVSVLQHIGTLLTSLLKEGLNENSIKSEYAQVYQILDLAIDYGIPFIDENNPISTIINRPPIDPKNRGMNRLQFDLEKPWRKVGIQRTNNEILVDVIEQVDLVVNPQGRTEFCHIRGEVKCTSRLSLKPLCKIILSSSTHFEDYQLHRCVEVDSGESKVIPFIPPDGTFTLMKYRLTALQSTVPLWLTPRFVFNKGSVSFDISMKPDLGLTKPLEEVEIRFTLPTGIGTPSLTSPEGRTSFDPNTRNVTWIIPLYSRKEPCLLKGSASTESGFDHCDRFPIVSAKFIYVGGTTSGFKIDRLETEGVDYKSFKGVKYITTGGSYEFLSGQF